MIIFLFLVSRQISLECSWCYVFLNNLFNYFFQVWHFVWEVFTFPIGRQVVGSEPLPTAWAMEDGFQKTWQECCDRFNVDTERGLSEGQVKKNLEQYGPNGKWKSKH